MSSCPFLIRSSCLEFCQHGQIFSELDLSLLLLFQFRLKMLSPANYVQLLKTKITLDKNINEKIIPRKEDEFLWISWLVLICCQYWVMELVYISLGPQVYLLDYMYEDEGRFLIIIILIRNITNSRVMRLEKHINYSIWINIISLQVLAPQYFCVKIMFVTRVALTDHLTELGARCADCCGLE